MDNIRISAVKVGAFVVIALAVLIVGALWVAGSTFLGSKRVGYVVAMRDSGGLQAGDRVRISGVSVGRIQHVDLYAHREPPVELRIKIKPDVPIKADASATVHTSGMLGSTYLQIDPGSATAPPLAAGSTIRGSKSPGLEETLTQVGRISDKVMIVLDQVSGLLDTVGGEIGPILTNLESLLSEDNAENARQILANLRGVTDDAGPKLTSLLDRLNSVSEKLDGGADGIPEITEDLAALIADVRNALGPDGARLAGVLESAGRSLESADRTLSILDDNRDEIGATLRDLRDTVANLKAFSQQVMERPYSLVRVKPEPEGKPGQYVKEEER